MGANILLAEEIGQGQGIKIAIGEMENTLSSIYRDGYGFQVLLIISLLLE